MLEDAINTLAMAVESLADAITRDKRTPAPITIVKAQQCCEGGGCETCNWHNNTKAVCMDEAGVPTTFKRRCSICNEIGRNARTHQDEIRNGTHHWVEVKQ